MAIKPNASTCQIREQTIEDLPSNREIVFDTEGRAIGVGPLLKKVPM